MNNTIKKALFIGVVTVFFPLGSQAADWNNNFVIKGTVPNTCRAFVEERNKLSESHHRTMAWLTGYISAYNNITPETYDVTPWQSVDTLSTLLAMHCAKHPDEPFSHAVSKLVNTLAPDRLETISEALLVTSGDKKFAIYKDVISRLQVALKEKGYLKIKWPNGNYDKATFAAMKVFQAERKLPPTGLPDQKSLYNLFLK